MRKKDTSAGQIQKENMDARSLERVYEMVTGFQEKNHAKNQKRIRIGLRCFFIIPAIFLFLLMVTKSSKIIFLALWIVSLFGLAIYLIAVEYMDYQLQEQISRVKGEAHAPVDGLTEMGRLEDRIDRFESHVDRYESVVERVESKVDEVAAAAKGRLLTDRERADAQGEEEHK